MLQAHYAYFLAQPILIDIRWLLAALILFGLVICFILTAVVVIGIRLHRRHIRKIAAEERLTITFRYRGPPTHRCCIFIVVFYFILAILTVILTALGIIPIQVSPAMEDQMIMAAMIILVFLIDGMLPTSLIAALILSIRDHRDSLRNARSKRR